MSLGTVVLLVLGALFLIGFVLVARQITRAVKGDPTVWEPEIRRLERHDRRGMPPEGVIVFTGSSSIRFWKTLKEDMSPLRVLNRGFGGSQIFEVTHYVDRIVLPYRPRGVVLYAGENDIAGVKFSRKRSAEELQNDFQQFCFAVHSHLPQAAIYYVSIKPLKLRLRLWPEMQKANRLIERFTESDMRLHFVDVSTAMLDAAGEPRRDLFKWDGIHMNEEGYVIWTRILRPILLEEFGAAEEKRDVPPG
jgi:lysophospholipase L1-like esterase